MARLLAIFTSIIERLIMAILEFLFQVIIWMAIFHLINIILVNREIIRRNKIQEELDKENEVPLLNLETHNDIMYLFDHKTDSFICQGNTVDELIKNLGEYKKIDIAWVKYDEKIMLIKNGFLHVVTPTNTNV
jgi:hypothetical protein